jgi:hypothetical protein
MKFRHLDMPAHAACAALGRRRKRLLVRIAGLRAAPDAEFVHRFAAVVAEVETAFRHEEALLELLGDACLHPRRADHAVVLCALHRAACRVEGGDVVLGRQVAAALDAILRLPFQARPPAPQLARRTLHTPR